MGCATGPAVVTGPDASEEYYEGQLRSLDREERAMQAEPTYQSCLPTPEERYCADLLNTVRENMSLLAASRQRLMASLRAHRGERQADADAAAAESRRGRWSAVAAGLQSYSAIKSATPTPSYSAPSYSPPPAVSGCSSDFSCGSGRRCVKPNYSSTGTCMQTVNEYGGQDYRAPALESVNPKSPSPNDCSYSKGCPAGFRCDYASGACVR